MAKGKRILIISTVVVVGLFFLFKGLFEARNFLAPLFTSIILALIVLPLSQKLERKGLSRGLSSFISTICLLLISLGFLTLLSFQVQSFVNDLPQIKETMKPKVEQLKSYAFEHTPLNKEDLNQSQSGSSSSLLETGSDRGQQAFRFLRGITSFVGTFLLSLIYIFFLLNYRQRFRKFLIRLFPKEKKGEVNKVIRKSATVSQQYLLGKLILMGLLAIIYSIGLGISGVNNFILVSIIAALLTLIPYIGNIIGLTMALTLGYLTSGETGVLIGVILTFTIAQFGESYVLQPYVVGDKVNLHPFFVIVGVIIGGALWGVLGMILAIPILAIITVIFNHVEPLHPFGILFSKKDMETD